MRFIPYYNLDLDIAAATLILQYCCYTIVAAVLLLQYCCRSIVAAVLLLQYCCRSIVAALLLLPHSCCDKTQKNLEYSMKSHISLFYFSL